MTRNEAVLKRDNLLKKVLAFDTTNELNLAESIKLSFYAEILNTFIALPPEEYNKVKLDMQNSYEELKVLLDSILTKKRIIRVPEKYISVVNQFSISNCKSVNLYKRQRVMELIIS